MEACCKWTRKRARLLSARRIRRVGHAMARCAQKTSGLIMYSGRCSRRQSLAGARGTTCSDLQRAEPKRNYIEHDTVWCAVLTRGRTDRQTKHLGYRKHQPECNNNASLWSSQHVQLAATGRQFGSEPSPLVRRYLEVGRRCPKQHSASQAAAQRADGVGERCAPAMHASATVLHFPSHSVTPWR